MSRNPAYDRTLEELSEVHDSKNEDYATIEDPFLNLRSSEDYGIPAWVGTQIRHDDKTRRIQEFVKKGRLNNESVRDSLVDQANYAILALALYDQAFVSGDETRGVSFDDPPPPTPGWQDQG